MKGYKKSDIYNDVTVDSSIIMPNHVHMILTLRKPGENGRSYGVNIAETRRNGRPMAAPTISRIVNQFKGSVSKQLGYSIWQKLFHDRIIRNEEEYIRIAQYIEQNPKCWKDDCFHPVNWEKNEMYPNE